MVVRILSFDVRIGGEKMKKKKALSLLVILLLVGVASVYVVGTFAKYTSSVDKNGSATVAKWAFNDDNTAGNLSITITPTADASTLASSKIAPGTSGSFDIEVSNLNSEVGINYEITFTDISNLPTNLVFKQNGTAMNDTTGMTKKITGTLQKGHTATIPVTWEWPYETTGGDSADTTDGAAAQTLTFKAHIVGTQVTPSATAMSADSFSAVAIGG